MVRRKKTVDLDAIAAEREQLKEQLRELEAREKAAIEAKKDAGRAPLMAALARVKIAEMDKGQAKAIAQAISKLGAPEVARRLSSETSQL